MKEWANQTLLWEQMFEESFAFIKEMFPGNISLQPLTQVHIASVTAFSQLDYGLFWSDRYIMGL